MKTDPKRLDCPECEGTLDLNECKSCQEWQIDQFEMLRYMQNEPKNTQPAELGKL